MIMSCNADLLCCVVSICVLLYGVVYVHAMGCVRLFGVMWIGVISYKCCYVVLCSICVLICTSALWCVALYHHMSNISDRACIQQRTLQVIITGRIVSERWNASAARGMETSRSSGCYRRVSTSQGLLFSSRGAQEPQWASAVPVKPARGSACFAIGQSQGGWVDLIRMCVCL